MNKQYKTAFVSNTKQKKEFENRKAVKHSNYKFEDEIGRIERTADGKYSKKVLQRAFLSSIMCLQSPRRKQNE